MTIRHRIAVATLCTFLLIVLNACTTASAQKKPLKINGSGVILEDVLFAPGASAPHCATGRVTAGLGKYTGLGAVQVIDPANMTFASEVPFRFVKNGNGDILAMHYGRTDVASGASPTAASEGIVMLEPVGATGLFRTIWCAEFNPVPSECTGKFADVVAGSLMMRAESDAFVLSFTNDDPPVPFIPGGTKYSWSGEGTIEFQ